MPAARRFVTAPSTDARDFGRDALIETLRSLLPQDALVVGTRGLRGRLGLLGKETVDLADLSSVADLAALWHREHGALLEGGPSALAVSIGADSAVAAEALAAATTAVAGELELASIRVFQFAERDAAATKQLVRTFRRVTEIPVSVVTHTDSVADTASAFAACNLVVTHDAAVAAIATSVHTPAVSLDDHTDITELYLAIRTATSDPESARVDDRAARALALALDAWARGRMSTADLHGAIADPTRVGELVGA